MKFADEEIFSWGVKNPRKEPEVRIAGNWINIDWRGTNITENLNDYNFENNDLPETVAIEVLKDVLLQRYRTNERN
ncbi:hypothetical protein [Liquorilactobacillus sicerae]|uniref:hypothetical protein n=1 Tax=Liquorilactobacillus sicerae TaxID=1416943 RepID=UPI0024801ED2|nr:hypothetical protein [Liquorilactobacillus sicerae]